MSQFAAWELSRECPLRSGLEQRCHETVLSSQGEWASRGGCAHLAALRLIVALAAAGVVGGQAARGALLGLLLRDLRRNGPPVLLRRGQAPREEGVLQQLHGCRPGLCGRPQTPACHPALLALSRPQGLPRASALSGISKASAHLAVCLGPAVCTGCGGLESLQAPGICLAGACTTEGDTTEYMPNRTVQPHCSDNQ